MKNKRLFVLFFVALSIFGFAGCKTQKYLKDHAEINYQALLQHTNLYDSIEDFRITNVQPVGKGENGKMAYDVWVSIIFSRDFDLSDPAATAESLKLKTPAYDWVDEYYRYFHFSIQKKDGAKAYFYDFTE